VRASGVSGEGDVVLRKRGSVSCESAERPGGRVEAFRFDVDSFSAGDMALCVA